MVMNPLPRAFSLSTMAAGQGRAGQGSPPAGAVLVSLCRSLLLCVCCRRTSRGCAATLYCIHYTEYSTAVPLNSTIETTDSKRLTASDWAKPQRAQRYAGEEGQSPENSSINLRLLPGPSLLIQGDWGDSPASV
jgi:hypothetical protein